MQVTRNNYRPYPMHHNHYYTTMTSILALLLAGCIPSKEPLSDINKSESDKSLIGKWQFNDNGKQRTLHIDDYKLDGNPRSLFRIKGDSDPLYNSDWFFTSILNGHCYINMLNIKTGEISIANDFTKWHSNKTRSYFIIYCRVDKDKLILNQGSITAYERIKADLEKKESKTLPSDWLVNYLAASGPNTLFPESEDYMATRIK